MGSTHFLTRTLEKVKTEMSLQVRAYNMKRMINIFGVNPLMQAIVAWLRAPAGASHRCCAIPASEIMFSHGLGRFDPFGAPSGNERYLRTPAIQTDRYPK
jgi:hypothetical protein